VAKIAPPSGRLLRFLKESTPYELLSALVTLSAGVVSASEKQSATAAILILLGVVLFVLTTVKLTVIWWTKEKLRSAHRLESSLYALHAILSSDADEANPPKLRVTIHVPTPNEKELEQVLDYVGDSRAGATAGRKFSVSCGIIGEAFRRKETLAATRQSADTEGYVKELIEDWGYTESDARKRDHSAMSWLAIPLESGDKKRVEGIVYCDSVDPEFFTEIRTQLAYYACVGGVQSLSCA